MKIFKYFSWFYFSFRTKIEALNPCALIENVRFVIVNEIPSIARLVKPYFPSKLIESKMSSIIKSILKSDYFLRIIRIR